MTIAVKPLTGADLTAALDDLAALRIAVFAEWPYLYAGDPAYERRYLADYAAAPDAVLIAALDGAQLVGAATAAPMDQQAEVFRSAVAAQGLDVARLCYFGESVLLPAWRGRGIGHAFFDAREAHARTIGATATCFAAVIRPADHPARPADYRPLDAFWRKRGYQPVAGLETMLDWQEHGHDHETSHPMQFWWHRLDDHTP